MTDTDSTPKIQTGESSSNVIGEGRFQRKGVGPAGVAHDAPLSFEQLQAAGADTGFLETKAGAALRRFVEEVAYTGQNVKVMLGKEVFEVSLDSLQRMPLTEIPEIAKHIKQSGVKKLTLYIPFMADATHYDHLSAEFDVAELSGKKFLGMIAENVARNKPTAHVSLGTLAKEQSLADRLSTMTAMEKGWIAAYAGMAALCLLDAVRSFRSSVETDPDGGNRHIRWGPLTYASFQTFMGGLLATYAVQQFRTGR